MSVITSIFVLFILFAVSLLISEYFVKRLKIERTKKGAFSAGRKMGFIVIEIALMIFLIISCFALPVYYPYPVSLYITMYFTLTYLFRGLEEWIYYKSYKGYYHDWLAFITFLVMFIFFTGQMFLRETGLQTLVLAVKK